MILAFDMFGTLADPAGVAGELAPVCGDQAAQVAGDWRARQLEYMFRVTAMGQFPSFADLTRWSLIRALAERGIRLAEPEAARLAGAYRRLPPFPDVRPALAALAAAGHTSVIFSVGPRAWLEDLARPYRELVGGMISAQDAGAYKPHPAIYRHLLSVTGSAAADTLVVSGNPFDLIGAGAAGLRTAWCRRQPGALFDPWGPRPDHTAGSLSELAGLLAAR